MRSLLFLCLAGALGVTVTACKPESSENKTPHAAEKSAPADAKTDSLFGGIFSGEPKPAALDLGEFKLIEVQLGSALDTDNMVATPKTTFGRKDKIYASVLSSGKHQGLKIKARWTAPDGNLVAEAEQALVPTNGTVSTFSISNAELWPAGAYTLDISLNGLVQRTVSFEVN